MNKPKKYYSILNLADGQYLEIAYNLRSRKEIAKVMREYLQPHTDILDYSTMSDKVFLHYIRHSMLDRWKVEMSNEPFDWCIFETFPN